MKRSHRVKALLPLFDPGIAKRSDREIAELALRLHTMWKAGELGGEIMPEDVHPNLPLESDELAAYFTLGMALNYQRNSYSLWRSCTAAFEDQSTRWVFDPLTVAKADPSRLSEALLRHRVALQPNRHPQIWLRNAQGIVEVSAGSVKTLFESADYDLRLVREKIIQNRTRFPYLCGPKISNYWLYVISTYMRWPVTNRECLTVAPDTHVISASIRLGVVPPDAGGNAHQAEVTRRWSEILEPTHLLPIDIHTPLWLWSRGGFVGLDGV